ncbi:gliding motility-associated C-terminal domain-containing protein [Hymenobacter metallilatus]|uniref:Gliding motility-associated C-terminal domain-containing protein n=2 Tax=Hymenobacter metallilatus TaxID=2493666 RepID=A0A3R9N214_9BACT|nr:gliding motility-associated C-terminal domain-containing protein [Hymenobacter metallilatus]
MKKLLHAPLVLFLSWCISVVGMQQARASHAQGGQLTYTALGNNQYRISCRFFRDCSGIAAPTTLSLSVKNGSCSAAATTYTLNQVGALENGSPYCASVPGGPTQCTSTGRTNFQTAKYETTITLPPAAEWILSVSESSRPAIGNLVSSSGENMYYEARLNNLLSVNGVNTTIQNSSPQYQDQDIPIPFVCWQQRTTITFSALEADGDSLVYSLDRPLAGCNDTIAYNTFASGGIQVISTNPPCVLQLPSNGRYSPLFPISSFTTTGVCPVKTAVPDFRFDAQLGSMTFTPGVYVQPNAAGNTDNYLNKYSLVGKVTEYRRINGRYYKVGSVRRDFLVIVIDCGGNTTPAPPIASGPPKTGVQIINTDSTLITAYTCNYSEVRIKFSDPNPGDLLTVTYPKDTDPVFAAEVKQTILPIDVARFTIVGNGTTTPYGILKIQPDVLFTGKTFRIPVQITDNACPIKGVQNRILVLKIAKGNFAKVVPSVNNPYVCAGTQVDLTATPFRPDSVGLQLAQYDYRWKLGNGMAPADTVKQTLKVTPTQTTRYYVRIIGKNFRLTPKPTCVDTASVLVRVAPALTANFTVAVRNGGTSASVPPRIYTFTNTSISRVTTDSVRWTYQLVKDGDGNPVTGAPVVVFSRKFDPGADVLTIREGGTYKFTLSINNTAGIAPNKTQCTASTKSVEVVVPKLEIPNVFTPNGDGKNETFVLTAGQEGNKVQIFNRWGRLIKEYANYQNDWTGEEQPAGVYYYLLTDRAGKTTKGWVQLSR